MKAVSAPGATDNSLTDWATDFDCLDPDWVENACPIWDALRSKRPIAHTDRFMGIYLPTRYTDVRSIALDRNTSHRAGAFYGMDGLRCSPHHLLRQIHRHIRRKKNVLQPFFLRLKRSPDTNREHRQSAVNRKRLVAEPQLIPTAVEEFLRAYAPATAAREVAKETQINGSLLKGDHDFHGCQSCSEETSRDRDLSPSLSC